MTRGESTLPLSRPVPNGAALTLRPGSRSRLYVAGSDRPAKRRPILTRWRLGLGPRDGVADKPAAGLDPLAGRLGVYIRQ